MEQSGAYTIHIPKFGELDEPIEMRAGDVLFIVGTNGAGKSGLLYHINRHHANKTCWIRATRQTFFAKSFNMMQPNRIRSFEEGIQRSERQHQARFVDEYVSDKPNIVVSKIMHAVQKQNAELSKFTRLGGGTASAFWKENKSPLDRLNHILLKANLPIVEEGVGYDENVLVRNNNGDEYSIAQLSDGERTAVLIATEIITAPLGTLILIDEPERHLHRSVTSPLMRELFSERPDCCFIISTHDITLPTDNPESRTLLVRGCKYKDDAPQKWDVDLVKSSRGIDKETLVDILGARRKLLFVEGEKGSLDSQLYSAVLPDVSVIPKGSFIAVEQAVKSIRNSGELDWPEVYGLIDKDEREPEEIRSLEDSGIYSLPVRAVESLYYSQKMLEMSIKYTPHLRGTTADGLLEKVMEEAVKAFSNSIDYLSKTSAELKIRRKVLEQIPNHKDDDFPENLDIDLNPKQVVKEESKKLREIVVKNDFDTLVDNYPIRHTDVPSRIVSVLGMKRIAYVQTVCQMIREKQDAKNYVIGMLGKLYEDITAT